MHISSWQVSAGVNPNPLDIVVDRGYSRSKPECSSAELGKDKLNSILSESVSDSLPLAQAKALPLQKP